MMPSSLGDGWADAGSWVGVLAALAAMVSVFLFVLAADRLRPTRRVHDRLTRFGLLDIPAEGALGSAADSRSPTLLRRLGAAAKPRVGPDRLGQWQRDLVQAGLAERWTGEEYLGWRVVAALGGVLTGLLLLTSVVVAIGASPLVWAAPLLGAAVGGALGYLLPALLVRRYARRRRATIERLLPGTLDVLVVSLEAGLGLDTAIGFIGERHDDPLAAELRRYLADMRLGRSRHEALDALVARTRSEALRDFAAAILQAEELGTGLTRAVRGQVVALRAARRVRAEELAREAPVKLVIPIALFLMPVLFIIIIGPALIQALAAFAGP